MGCTSSLIPIPQPQSPTQPTHTTKETACIQVIIPSPCPALEASEQMNTKMKRQKQKIHFLQQSQCFMKESVEISQQVQQALLSLTYNPLLHDSSYYKLIGLNKKTLQKKQNRMNNLQKRESQAQQELKKEKDRKIEKTRSQMINYRIPKRREKENREQPALTHFSHSKESFTQKMSRVQLYLIDSPLQ